MHVSFSGNALKRINELLAEVRGVGTRRLGTAVAATVVAGNRADRMEGKDSRGVGLPALVSKRTGKYRGMSGPPLVPRGEQSRAIADFHARVSFREGGWTLTAGWSGDAPYILAFHAEGRGRYGPIARRNCLGISPRTRSCIFQLIQQWKDGLLRKPGAQLTIPPPLGSYANPIDGGPG